MGIIAAISHKFYKLYFHIWYLYLYIIFIGSGHIAQNKIVFKHTLVYNNNKEFIEYKNKPKCPYWLKIMVNHNNINAFLSFDGVCWDDICQCKIQDFGLSERIIGIDINLEDNQYFNWFFLNYIQLFANHCSNIPIEYPVAPYKNYKMYTYNPFINFNTERREVIESQFETIIEFIKKNIDCDRYIEIFLDEIYIYNRHPYRKYHFKHENLIYGYDKESIYILGVSQGKPITSQMPIETFLEAYNACKESVNIIYVFDYLPDVYDFNIKRVIDSLNEYLTGFISNNEIYNIPDYKNRSFGINVYDEYLSETGIEIIINDIRISYS